LTSVFRKLIGLGVLAAIIATTPAAAFPGRRAERTLRCGDVAGLMRLALSKHVQFHTFDDGLRRRAAESFVRAIDPSRILFREDEAKGAQEEAGRLFLSSRSGDCEQLADINDKLVRRMRELHAYVESVVGSKNYTVDRTVELVVDPDMRGHPKTAKEQKALWRKYVHFQMATYLDAGTPLEEAKKLLPHRYALMIKRTEEADEEDRYGMLIDAFASALDPHTDYFSADDLENFEIGMRLSLEGIGAVLSSRDGYVTVERLVPGGAAARHGGIAAGDKIIAVGQEGGDAVNVIDMPLDDVVRMIRGKKGTAVRLTLLRAGKKQKRKTITIVREKIRLEEQAAQLRIETIERKGREIKVGLLELPSFYGDMGPASDGPRSLSDVRKLLDEARKAKVEGLVLDLSRNGGGLLQEAVAIAGLFLRSGGVVAVRETGDDPQVLDDPDPSLVYDAPLVVLVSRVSASGAEIVAGALQDYGRAVIVGDRKTFGKGSVQTVIPLPGRLGALKVTIGMYFLPGGASTQAEGVRSDIVVPSLTDSEQIGEDALPNALPSQKIDRFVGRRFNGPNGPDRFDPITRTLLTKVVKLSNQRVAASSELKKVAEQLASLEARSGVVSLGETAEDDGNNNDEDNGGESDEGLNAQQREALEVLADLILDAEH
jgi:carboxyl-terminal processing protease